MGNTSSSDAGSNPKQRPSLKSTLSSSSTATLKGRESQKRRKSIELPDLQAGQWALTPTASPFDLKGKALPPAATQIYHDGQRRPPPPSDDVLLGSTLADIKGIPAQPIPMPPVSSPDELTLVQGKDLPTAIDEAIQKHMSKTPTASAPLASRPAPVPLPANQGFLGSTQASRPCVEELVPAAPPQATVVAPYIPEAIDLPLGTGASATTSLIVGSPLHSDPSTPISSPSLNVSRLDLDGGQHFAPHSDRGEHPSALQVISEVHSDLNDTSSAPTHAATVPLPAAAPLVALTGPLSHDVAAAEAVKAATVDLGAGAEGVPTLLTWTPGETDAPEGEYPEKVYVTGTFAKDWTTKIELRRKQSQNDFTALVNLPVGPHTLKFIVDDNWKTSRNLPSATDQHGHLINYLQVSKSDGPTQAAPKQALPTAEDLERWRQEELQWTREIPSELVAFGERFEAEEAAALAQERQNQLLMEQGLPPERMPPLMSSERQIPPPMLPAQLQRGILNSGGMMGQDDNSILPKPDHSVIDHLAASPMSKGLLSVAITKRYRRKFATTIFYKPVPSPMA